MTLNFRNVRPKWHLPPYPPYHEGPYLEEYFYQTYLKNKNSFDRTGRILIPIYWTSCYLQQIDVQPYIDALPKYQKYFAVSQHDDAIKEKLPEDTICFCAGGNAGGIPIPLVCSLIPDIYTTHRMYRWEKIERADEKSFLCSFVGSITHSVRKKLFDKLQHEDGFKWCLGDWSFNIGGNKRDMFFDYTRRSMFTLCPRGYGAQSFRTYEALQLGSVPVYVHDDNKWLPFENKINWNDFSVVVHENDIERIPDILKAITPEQYDKMRKAGEDIYNSYFTLEGVSTQIYKYLNEINNN